MSGFLINCNIVLASLVIIKEVLKIIFFIMCLYLSWCIIYDLEGVAHYHGCCHIISKYWFKIKDLLNQRITCKFDNIKL